MQCKAKTRRGEQCGSHAIQGGTVCRMHGGGSPRVKAAASRNKDMTAARQQLAALGQPEAVDPAAALLELISWKYGEVKWLRAQVQEIPDESLTWGRAETEVGLGKDGPIDKTTEKANPSVWWTLLREAEDQLADYSTRALKAGIAERQIRMAEQQGLLVHRVLMAILERVDLSARQWELAKVAAPEELRRLADG